jgi:hypothetical protein
MIRVKPKVVAEKEEPLVPYPVDLVVDPNVAIVNLFRTRNYASRFRTAASGS